MNENKISTDLDDLNQVVAQVADQHSDQELPARHVGHKLVQVVDHCCRMCVLEGEHLVGIRYKFCTHFCLSGKYGRRGSSTVTRRLHNNKTHGAYFSGAGWLVARIRVRSQGYNWLSTSVVLPIIICGGYKWTLTMRCGHTGVSSILKVSGGENKTKRRRLRFLEVIHMTETCVLLITNYHVYFEVVVWGALAGSIIYYLPGTTYG